MNAYQIVFLCFVCVIAIIYFVDRFTGRKITLAIIQWHPAISALSAFVKAAAAVLPSHYFTIVSIVLDAASAATQEAEHLYMMNLLSKEERNEYAQKLIVDVLQTAGIDVTEQVQQIIDGCIAAICMLMPHGLEPVCDDATK